MSSPPDSSSEGDTLRPPNSTSNGWLQRRFSSERVRRSCRPRILEAIGANIVTYSVAYLCHRVSSRIDLDRIWLKQSLSPALAAAIEMVCHPVHAVLTDPPDHGNVTEWCKKPICWKRIQEIDVALPSRLEDELISVGRQEMRRVDRGVGGIGHRGGKAHRAKRSAVPAERWFRISNWATEHSVTLSLGREALPIVWEEQPTLVRDPSYRQAAQGLRLFEEAERLGFR